MSISSPFAINYHCKKAKLRKYRKIFFFQMRSSEKRNEKKRVWGALAHTNNAHQLVFAVCLSFFSAAVYTFSSRLLLCVGVPPQARAREILCSFFFSCECVCCVLSFLGKEFLKRNLSNVSVSVEPSCRQGNLASATRDLIFPHFSPQSSEWVRLCILIEFIKKSKYHLVCISKACHTQHLFRWWNLNFYLW
jgi:hypothetical protein